MPLLSACQKRGNFLKIAHPLTPSLKGGGNSGGCYRTLHPLTCGALFGYISGVIGGEAPYMRRMS